MLNEDYELGRSEPCLRACLSAAPNPPGLHDLPGGGLQVLGLGMLVLVWCMRVCSGVLRKKYIVVAVRKIDDVVSIDCRLLCPSGARFG